MIQDYIFKRASEDCTNFVSQCVWAGYGRTAGVTIPTTPTVNDRTHIALKNRVKANRLMASAWFGRNYSNTRHTDEMVSKIDMKLCLLCGIFSLS
ncbi:MAG: hypothetical protein HFI81_04350 [Eubacterium sp.]|nr:hypothetical protein [Eubacterium sp.]